MLGTEEQATAPAAEMPRYQSHKRVWALKIGAVGLGAASGGALLVPDDTRYRPIDVSAEYMRKHDPQPGGYYVVYADGYQSYSPAEAFEGGYTRLAPSGEAVNNLPRRASERLSLTNVREAFTYQPWDANQQARGKAVTEALINAAEAVLQAVPECPTRTRALNNLVDARMLANAAITHEGRY